MHSTAPPVGQGRVEGVGLSRHMLVASIFKKPKSVQHVLSSLSSLSIGFMSRLKGTTILLGGDTVRTAGLVTAHPAK